ncbi:hypothetical protein N7490_012214 [Penicillium lividum]|nr:hypothetical protein N7490_012214 [Penicillium lividum]
MSRIFQYPHYGRIHRDSPPQSHDCRQQPKKRGREEEEGVAEEKKTVDKWARRNYRRRQAKKARKAEETDAEAIIRLRGELEARNEETRKEVEDNEAVDDYQLAQRSLMPGKNNGDVSD